jgi:hypothetical protein
MPIQSKLTDASVINFNRYRVEGNRSVYTSPLNTDANKDQLILSSTAPKSTTTTSGNRRSSLRLIGTENIMDITNTTLKEQRDSLVRVDTSIPVGMSLTEFENRCAIMGNLLLDSAFIKSLFVDGQIHY